MHPMLNDQQIYDIIFGLYRAIILLAGETNDMERARGEMTARALVAEAKLYNARIERDFWKHRAKLRKASAPLGRTGGSNAETSNTRAYESS